MSSPIIPLTETIGLETQQHPTLKTLDEKKGEKTSVKGSTNVEKNGLEFDKVGQKSFNYDSSLCRKCSMSPNNNTDSIQCERCDGWHCKLCSNLNEALDIFCNALSALWFCEKCEPKAILTGIYSVKMDKLVEEKCVKCFNYINVRIIKLEKDMSTRASSDDVDALLRRCTVLENEVANLGDALKSNQGSNEAGLEEK